MQKAILIIILVIVAVLGIRFFIGGNEDNWVCQNGQWVKHGNPSMPQPIEACPGSNNAQLANPASVNCEQKGGKLEIKDTDNGQMGICTLPDGTKCEEWSFSRDECKSGNNIVVYQPLRDEIISPPFKFLGEARKWYFEASFPIDVVDNQNNKIAAGYAKALSDWMTADYVPFEIGDLKFLSYPNATTSGFIVFKKDNPSDLRELDEEYRLPVVIPPIETVKIKLYFNNNKMDPEVSCNKVFPVERELPKTQALARTTLEELLKGEITDKERVAGYSTSLNYGVKIQNLVIENGIAKVDFNETLENPGGGSCRVSAIRAQIIETLKQFSTIKSVIISIDGRIEDILQP